EQGKLCDVPALAPPPPPLFLGRWFARRTRSCDLLLLLLEMLTMSATHTAQLMFRRVCVPVGGGPHAALQELPLHPARHRADALLAAFPCGAGYAGRLLYVLRTAAAIDPRVALRFADFGDLGRVLGQLATLTVLLACPRLYERTRHGLFFAQNAAVLLGACASAAWTPAALLPLGGAALLSAGRRRMGAVYFGWKAVLVHRLLFGPALWLLAVLSMGPLDRRLLPPGASQPQHLQAPHVALLFVVMAVLPYLACRYFESTSRPPQYREHLQNRGDASNGGVCSRRAPLYVSSRGGAERVRLISVKVALPGGGHTPGDLSFAATAALAQNAAASAAAARSGAGSVSFSLLSTLCIEGCVHVLMMVRRGSDGGSGSGGIHHVRIGEAEAASGGVGAAVESACSLLLTDASGGGGGGGGSSSASLQPAPGAFAWPPVLPLSAAAEGGATAGYCINNAREAQQPQPAEVLLLLPTPSLAGLGAVRCVVAGRASQPQQRQQVHLDATLAIASANTGIEGGGGFRAFRLMLPPAALQKAESLTVFVLPPSSADAAPPAAAATPLAAFPLLALPAAAAAEVMQLYGAVLDDAVYDSLQQLLLEGTAGGGPCGWSLAASASAAAASASAAIQQSGLISLSHDIGALLQLPGSATEEALEGGAGDGAGSEAPAEQLLRFLAEEALEDVADGDAGGAPEEQLPFEASSFADLFRFLASQRMGACLREGLRALRRAGVRLACKGGAFPNGEGAVEAAALQLIREAGGAGAWALSLSGSLRWWLHVLLLGFSPPGQERSCQAFKAARCWRVNLMAFGLLSAARLATCLRTLRAGRAETALVPAAADGIGAGRLTSLQQQLLAQAIHVGVAFIFAALASCTPLLRRRRTALLLSYKAVVDPITLLLILWPSTWGGPLLRTPAAWLDASRRYGLHWLYLSLLEPGLLQLSPRHQLWAALANLLPMTLLGLQVYRGRWAPALGFGIGNALLGLAMSLATDLAACWQFVRWRSNAQPDKAE
ncbi:hypothetical protein TSOC_008454, partial [Tetrabaena socialis]